MLAQATGAAAYQQSKAFTASIQQTAFHSQPVTLQMGQQTRGYVNLHMLEHKHVIANFNP